jgi:hypothetical protein
LNSSNIVVHQNSDYTTNLHSTPFFMPKVIGDLRLYDLDELSNLLGMHKKSLTDKYIKTGVIRARKFGVRWYVPEDALKEYFAEKENALPSLTHAPLQAAQQRRSHTTKHT